MDTKLGEKEYVYGWCLYGKCPTGEQLARILRKVVLEIGMTCYEDPVIKEFPTAEGKGGNGGLYHQTVAAPAEVFQCLTESAIMGNTYVDRNLTRIILSSCLPYDARRVGQLLEHQIGKIVRQGGFDL